VAGLHQGLFPNAPAQLQSIAQVPLLRNRRIIGSLNLGSVDATRFTAALGTDFIEHMASIIAICLENVISNEMLKYIGLTDSLTGVYNRRYIDRRLLEEIGRARRQAYRISCMYIDIDHFKLVNDSVGHQGGDEVLREVASRIKAELRISDALGRFGGEEFVVLLIDADLDSATMVAQRIRASIANIPFELSSGELMPVSVSIGVATLDDFERDHAIEGVAQQLVAQADSALYQAKETGRNRVVSFDD
jgi:two-component system cell cycle response regulator